MTFDLGTGPIGAQRTRGTPTGRRRRLFARRAPALAPLLAAMLVLSCAAPPPPAPPAPDLYTGLRESADEVDASALEGVRIVIDPGHGGEHAGAVGPGGLREADVNLGVALYLWGLLSDAGAEVTLTRSSDRTVAGGHDATLRDDLLARSEIANQDSADVFLSIHHNSDLSRDPTLNRIETYHKLFDAGPSTDIARAIHSHLSFNIGEHRGGVIPGNYLVLRSCRGPAVLGEPAFISNPLVERKLKDAAAQRLEAVAYFIGLVDYFSKGMPRLEALEPLPGEVTGPRPRIIVTADPGRAGYGIDPASIELRLDGDARRASWNESANAIEHAPRRPLAPGEHKVSVSARNTAGNWAPELSFAFTVETSPAHIVLDLRPKPAERGGFPTGAPVAIEARVYDVNMNPASDGTPVVFSSDRPVFPDTGYVEAGSAHCYVRPGPGGQFQVEARSGGASMGLAADPATGESEDGRWAFVRDAQDGSPIGRSVVLAGALNLARANRDGFVGFVPPGSEGGDWRVESPGYESPGLGPPLIEERPFSASSPETVNVIRLNRAAAGLLHDRVIVLDPEGGGDDRAGQGPSGTDASWVNFEVASALAEMIERTGGRAVMTRARGSGASDVERLMTAESSGASIYLLISHRPIYGGRGPQLGHYPGSSAGISLALAIAAASDILPLRSAPRLRESARYAVRQTSSPAVVTNLMPLDDRDVERYISRPWNAAREAYAIYAGLLLHLDREDTLSADRGSFAIELPDGEPARGALVTLDGYLPLRAGDDGTVVLTALTAGEHTLEAVLNGCAPERVSFSWPPAPGEARRSIRLTSSYRDD